MCKECVKQEYPDRGTICLETGTYLFNYNGCVQCQRKDQLEIKNETTTVDEEGEELTTYQHKCKNCDHIIAYHEYVFKVDGDFQEYGMECLLCGKAEDSISIMPDDPRRMNSLY